MRSVPGDGDCMFLAVALAALTSMGLGANNALLTAISREQRNVVASVLESGNAASAAGNLVIEGKRLVSTEALLKSAARKEGLTTDEYLTLLRKDGKNGGLYGGGPELTVLANILRRPISIYEIVDGTDDKGEINAVNGSAEPIEDYEIECKGVFGLETFQDPLMQVPDSAILSSSLQRDFQGAYSWHIHILVVDASPREKHACVLLPLAQDALL
ncbi:hypothetical protein MPSEU_000907000 [Mayamaea pseudoterrestris]|nr:hypothetical protein MPSEU_000907000 [Mayamaea pseudoterrestris]